jgi:L,D-peptidoglycan transpeptidase YkuD (ErfK/YbiS/YcfS/YnhG family)
MMVLICGPSQAQIPSSARQLIVSQAATWNSNTATLQCYQRTSASAPWQAVFAKSVPVLLGRAGLAWGRGVFNPPQNGIPAKVEKDWRAPAGVFQLGMLFGNAAKAPGGARWPYLQVGPWDAYVDDSSNPYYQKQFYSNFRKMVLSFRAERSVKKRLGR